MFAKPSWEKNRDKKQAEREARLIVTEVSDSVPISDDLPFLSCPARKIVSNIADKKPGWTATRVLHAFIRSTVRAQRKTNAVTEPLFTFALERAKELDASFAKTGKLVGPLHGVPLSLKDQIAFKGVDSTIGFTQDIDKPAEEDAEIVKILLKAGAVPFTKTNVPQTMLSFECGNPLFGPSKNPFDSERVPGGSSGGEAALLASDASACGIGSDIGGSLRIPAHYSGCFGLKPCLGRYVGRGARNPNKGFEAVKSTLGPMGRCVDDLALLSEVVFDYVAHSDLVRTDGLLPLPYRKVDLPKRLKFGYFIDNDLCRISPACQRAVLESVAALRKAGHECIEFTPPSAVDALEIFVGLTSSDGYEHLLSHLKGDPREKSLTLVTLGPRLYSPARGAATALLRRFAGDDKMARLIAAARIKTVHEMQEWQDRRNNYVLKVRQSLWSEHRFDGVICPVQSVPALKVGQTWNLSLLANATIQWNIVDSSVGVLPVTRVRDADALTDEWKARPQGSVTVEKAVYGPGGAYDAKAMAGLPVGVQVVAGQWEEEKCIAMMRVLESALGFASTGFGPGQYASKVSTADASA